MYPKALSSWQSVIEYQSLINIIHQKNFTHIDGILGMNPNEQRDVMVISRKLIYLYAIKFNH